jgi:hypothetical protein
LQGIADGQLGLDFAPGSKLIWNFLCWYTPSEVLGLVSVYHLDELVNYIIRGHFSIFGV